MESLSVTSNTERSIRSIFTTQTLVKGKIHSLSETLNHPALEIPARYRAILRSVPEVLKPLLTGLFGTQVHEEKKAEEQKSMQERTSVCDLELTSIARLLWYHNDPCAVLGGEYCLFGWGEGAMVEFNDHQRIVNEQRKRLNAVARIAGASSTWFKAGFYVSGLMLVQGVVAIHWLGVTPLSAIAATIPSALFALVCFTLFVKTFLHKRFVRASERKWTERALEKMEEKYPGFSTSDARIVDKEGKQ